jgi:hypothetical protein
VLNREPEEGKPDFTLRMTGIIDDSAERIREDGYASSKPTSCFWRFTACLPESHSKVNAISRTYCDVWASA